MSKIKKVICDGCGEITDARGITVCGGCGCELCDMCIEGTIDDEEFCYYCYNDWKRDIRDE